VDVKKWIEITSVQIPTLAANHPPRNIDSDATAIGGSAGAKSSLSHVAIYSNIREYLTHCPLYCGYNAQQWRAMTLPKWSGGPRRETFEDRNAGRFFERSPYFNGGLNLKFFATLAFAALTLTACQSTTDGAAVTQSGGTQLATQVDMEAIFGKTLMAGPGQSLMISANGTLNGTWNSAPLAGTFEMRDGFFCRTLSASPRGAAPEDCQLLVLDGNSINGTRDRGNGASFSYIVS